MPSYAGIGSRKTPVAVQDVMSNFAYVAGRHEWTLRTGGAAGADQAFERGATLGDCEIEMYLPWPGYEDHYMGTLDEPAPEAYEIAAKYHPNWSRLKQGARKLIARNTHQVLGEGLNDPSGIVVCWTENGSVDGSEPKTGGTGQALRIAADYGIPIRNLARMEHLEEIQEIANGHA